MKKLNFILILIIGFIIASCKTQKVVSGSNAEEMKTTSLIQNIISDQPVFKDLSIQSKINADIDETTVSLTGKIYIQKDRLIWVNVSKFGITAARALITPDGFKAFEKLDKTYIDGDFTYFNHLLKVDFIEYQTLQNLLLGRIFVDLNSAEFRSEVLENQYILSYKNNESLTEKPQEGKYIQRYKFNSDFKMTEANIQDPKTKMELNINYYNWKQVGTQYFPQNVKILVKDKKTQQVELEYNNFTFEKSDTPFEIPSGYKPNRLLK